VAPVLKDQLYVPSPNWQYQSIEGNPKHWSQLAAWPCPFSSTTGLTRERGLFALPWLPNVSALCYQYVIVNVEMCIHGLCQFPVRRGYQENVERASASSVVDHSQHVQLECTLSSPINTHSLNICGLSQKFLASLGNFGYKLNLLPEQKRAFIYILTDTHSFNGPFSGTTQVS